MSFETTSAAGYVMLGRSLFALLSLDVEVSKMGSSCHAGSHSSSFVRMK